MSQVHPSALQSTAASGHDFASVISRAIAFLAGEQQPDGGFVNRVWHKQSPQASQANVFPAALIAHSLSFAPEGECVRARALAFLEQERLPGGVWKHPARGEYTHFFFPPDVDDTACAAAALSAGGRCTAGSEKMLLANRDRGGLFYTWYAPRPRWAGIDHLRLVLPQVRHARFLVPLFSEPPCSIYNVDPVVNANALFCLGPRPETAVAARWIASILEEGSENGCDPWYPGAFTVRYFFARALAGRKEQERALMRLRLESAAPGTPLETAFHLAARAYCAIEPDPRCIEALLGSQEASGGWAAEPFYRGGDYWWGSAALSTAFAVEALARCRASETGVRGAGS